MYELHFSSKNLAPESEIRHLAAPGAGAAGAVLPGVSLATHSLDRVHGSRQSGAEWSCTGES